MKQFYFIFSILFLLFSCDKGEIPKPKPSGNGIETIQVSMGGNYENQVFYNLEKREIISQNNREIWDLAFETTENGFHIRLNDSKLMAAKASGHSDFSAFTSTQNTNWKYDRATGDLDSTAIDDWRGSDEIFIIDRGLSITGAQLGRFKIKFISVDESNYQIAYCPLNSTDVQYFTVQKNTNYSWTYFSFNDGGKTVQVAPQKEEWDLCFTSYTHIFEGHTPYLVTGVLLNSNSTSAQVHNLQFTEIQYANTLTQNYSNSLNFIGYDWKTYDFDQGIYVVDNTKTFVIKTQFNRIFKLRFIDFYDKNGIKGSPTMELVELFL